MNRNWNGFLPQNEVVKLQWAALEECQASHATERLAALLQLLGEGGVAKNELEEDDDDASLPG
jgi:hypothetical protein